MPRGGELRGVGAELGDDDPGVALSDPGDLIKPHRQPQDRSILPGAAGGVAAAGQPARSAARGRARPQTLQYPSSIVPPQLVQVLIATVLPAVWIN